MQSVVRVPFGLCLVHFPTGPSARSSSGLARSMFVQDPPVKDGARSTLGHASLTFARAPGGPIYFKPGPMYCFEDPRVQYWVRLRLG